MNHETLTNEEAIKKLTDMVRYTDLFHNSFCKFINLIFVIHERLAAKVNIKGHK